MGLRPTHGYESAMPRFIDSKRVATRLSTECYSLWVLKKSLFPKIAMYDSTLHFDHEKRGSLTIQLMSEMAMFRQTGLRTREPARSVVESRLDSRPRRGQTSGVRPR